MLEHRLKKSEEAGQDISLEDAVRSYVSDVLANRRDEASYLATGSTTEAISLPEPVPTGLIVAEDEEEGDWRDKV